MIVTPFEVYYDLRWAEKATKNLVFKESVIIT